MARELKYDKATKTIVVLGHVGHWGRVDRRRHMLHAMLPQSMKLRVGMKLVVEVTAIPRCGGECWERKRGPRE